MCTLNRVGSSFGRLPGVAAMTDVTGFGLLGHLTEMADGSGLTAYLWDNRVPRLDGIDHYLDLACVPGGTGRNFESYGHRVSTLSPRQRDLLCDPQTSGGLLVAVEPGADADFLEVAQEAGLQLEPIGHLRAATDVAVVVE
jgi:selenide,water dikinase